MTNPAVVEELRRAVAATQTTVADYDGVLRYVVKAV
jgi:hypothetical protein